MKKHLLSLAVAFSMLLPAATAIAADYDTMPPPPPPPPVDHLRPSAYDWTGGYVGIYAGMACVDGMLTDNIAGTNFLNAGCGVKGGGLAGYNIQMDEVVFGAEANIETTGRITSNMQTGADFNYRYDYIGRLNGRVGWAMDNTLFFIQGGGAYGMGHLVDNVSLGGTDLTAGHWGVSIGGGIEQAVSDSMRIRFDYLFTHFFDAHYGCAAACSINGWENEHEVRASAIWAF